MSVIELQPSDVVVRQWLEQFMPADDLFFADAGLLERIGTNQPILIIPREEFVEHPTYRDVQLANAYTYWTVDKAATHVIHAPQEWIAKLSSDLRRELLTYQVAVGRGLVFSVSDDQLSTRLLPYIVQLGENKYFILQRISWKLMTDLERLQLMIRYAKEWDLWTAHEVPVGIPNHLKRCANTFSTDAGSNCLAATLFAVTGEEWLLTQWVHPKTFLETLAHASYERVVDDVKVNGDVLTFWDDAERLKHATYRINQDLFFNKNGQAVFNPWKLIKESELFDAWGGYTVHIYRQTK